MRSRAPPPRTRFCGTVSTVPNRRGWFGTIRPQCERVRLVLRARWLSPESTDRVRHRTCADGTVRPPQPSTGQGTWTLLTGARVAVSGVISSQCVCGPASKVAQPRPRGAPRAPARYTLRVARPHTARVSIHAPSAQSAAKGQLFNPSHAVVRMAHDASCRTFPGSVRSLVGRPEPYKRPPGWPG